MPANLYLGLISGTSADGIDAALVEFDDANDARSTARLVFGRTYPWQPELRAQLVELGQHAARVSLDTIAELRSEEHTSELQSLMRISYAFFCLKQKKTDKI